MVSKLDQSWQCFCSQVDKGVKDLFGSEGEGTTQVGSNPKHIDVLQWTENLKLRMNVLLYQKFDIFRGWMTWMCAAASIKLMVVSLLSGDPF